MAVESIFTDRTRTNGSLSHLISLSPNFLLTSALFFVLLSFWSGMMELFDGEPPTP